MTSDAQMPIDNPKTLIIEKDLFLLKLRNAVIK